MIYVDWGDNYLNVKELVGITDENVVRRFEEIKISIELGVAKASKKLGVSRQYLYKWKRRYEKEGIEGLFDKSRAHKTHPSTTSPDDRDKVLEVVKANLMLSYKDISIELEKLGVIKHPTTIHKICRKAKLKKPHAKHKQKVTIIKESFFKITDKSWKKIQKRINDTYNLNFKMLNSVKVFEKKVEVLYEKCCFPSDVNFGLPSREDLYKHEIQEFIASFLQRMQ